MTSKKGFTLIELAVVIAIIAVLAAVAVPRFADTTSQAEKAMIVDLKAQLVSAAAIYTAEQAATPDSFTRFVSNNATASAPHTIALRGFSKTPGACTAAVTTITCAATAFGKWTGVRYDFNAGSISVNANPIPGNSLAAINQ